MKKSYKVIINSVSLVIMNLMFWICNYYPRHIFEIPSRWSASAIMMTLVAILMNLIYSFAYNLLLILIFRDNTTLFMGEKKSASQRRYIKSKDFAALCGITVLCDLMYRLQLQIFSTRGGVGAIVLTVAYWLIVYLFLTRKQERTVIGRRQGILLGAVLAIVLAVFILAEVVSVNSLTGTYEKYLPLSPIVTRSEINARFLSECRLLLLDLILSVLFLVFHQLSLRGKEPKTEEQTSGRSLLVFRVVLLFVGAFFLCGIKAMVFPCFMIKSYHARGSEGASHQEYGSFDYKVKIISLTRMNPEGEDESYYQKVIVTIQEEGLDSVTFEGLDWDACYTFVNGEKKPNDGYVVITVDKSNIYLYRNQWICCYDDGTPISVAIDDLMSLGSNRNMIALCRQLLRDGNLFVLEYAHEYLLNYDADFVMPYIERYAEESFTAEERDWMQVSAYREQYIVDIAKSLLK